MELEYFFNPSEPLFSGFGRVAKERMMMRIGDKPREMDAGELVAEGVAANQIMAYFLAREWEFYVRIGIDAKRMAFRVLGAGEIPHYSKGNIDMEVETSYGSIETIGNAYRTDFDLSQHSKHSGADLSVFIETEKKKIMPHVFELSMGVDRLFYCIMEHCFRDKDPPAKEGETPEGGRANKKEWEWFDFPPAIAPYHVAIFPLMCRDGMDAKAEEVAAMLRSSGLDATYRDSGSIGRRYARADEIGVPYALTVDYDTLKDGTVTIRYRNDGRQERIKISECADKIKECIRKGKVTL
jgi:glycyl-tRNA synthetase